MNPKIERVYVALLIMATVAGMGLVCAAIVFGWGG